MRRVPASRCWPDVEAVGPTPLTLLRTATRDAHEAVESAFDWQARVGTRAGYRGTLAALYGFHAGWEPRATAVLDGPAVFEGRSRLHLLRDDLRQLGMTDSAIDGLPRPDLPVLADPAAALGSLYVVEGSRLGGRLIARHVEAVLGLEQGAGASYHGAAAGAGWRTLCVHLDHALADEAALRMAIAAALDTFHCLGAVLAGAVLAGEPAEG